MTIDEQNFGKSAEGSGTHGDAQVPGDVGTTLHLRVEAAADLARHIDELARLRTREERDAYVDAFAWTLTPDGIDPELWKRWLAGGPRPYAGTSPRRPVTHGQSLSRDLARQSGTVKHAAYGVTKAKASLARAQERVQEAEAALIKARADDKASLQAAVYAALRSALEPMFAMGPAWTVIRALSGHTPVEEMEDQLRFEINAVKRAQLETTIRRERQEETEQILEALDCWAGDYGFERALRDAVLGVVNSHKGQSRSDGIRRTRAAMREGVADGELVRDQDAIIDGMKRRGT